MAKLGAIPFGLACALEVRHPPYKGHLSFTCTIPYESKAKRVSYPPLRYHLERVLRDMGGVTALGCKACALELVGRAWGWILEGGIGSAKLGARVPCAETLIQRHLRKIGATLGMHVLSTPIGSLLKVGGLHVKVNLVCQAAASLWRSETTSAWHETWR